MTFWARKLNRIIKKRQETLTTGNERYRETLRIDRDNAVAIVVRELEVKVCITEPVSLLGVRGRCAFAGMKIAFAGLAATASAIPFIMPEFKPDPLWLERRSTYTPPYAKKRGVKKSKRRGR